METSKTIEYYAIHADAKKRLVEVIVRGLGVNRTMEPTGTVYTSMRSASEALARKNAHLSVAVMQ